MTNKIWTTVGKPEQRIDAVEKSTGKFRYVGDYSVPGLMHAKLVKSTHAHAMIKSIDTTEAWKMPGVRAIVTGEMFPFPYWPYSSGPSPISIRKSTLLR